MTTKVIKRTRPSVKLRLIITSKTIKR